MFNTEKKYILAIDGGTMGVRSIIFDFDGHEISSSYFETPTYTPKPGYVEQNAEDFVNLAYKSTRTAIEKSKLDPKQIVTVSFTNMRATYVPVDKDGKFLHNIFIWQDQRGSEIFPWMRERLAKYGMTENDLYNKTGFPIQSVSQSSKVFWLKLKLPEIYEKTYKFLSPQGVLLHAYGATDWFDDSDDANWWQVCDKDTFKYSKEMAEVFDVDLDKYPILLPPGAKAGEITEKISKLTSLAVGTPIFVGSGDQQCGAAGVGNSGASGVGSVCLGTAGLCIGYSKDPVADPNISCHVLGHPGGGYTMEGHASAAASSFRWVRNTLCQHEMVIAEETGLDVYDLLTSAASQSPVGAKGMIYLPWLAGAACPHYDDNAKACFIGMNLQHKKSDFLRAAMEGICFEMREMLGALNRAGFPKFETIRVTGGAARSALWNQIQADIYNTVIETVETPEATALGAAMIAAVGIGAYKNLDEAAQHMVHVKDRWEPIPENVEHYDKIYDVFLACYNGLKDEAFPKVFELQKTYDGGKK
ncbi:MAG: FGGY family carbohydrate kinase [Anaerolineaceae bacterium]